MISNDLREISVDFIWREDKRKEFLNISAILLKNWKGVKEREREREMK